MFYSHNEEELIAIGRQIGSHLKPRDVLILTGELGSGKTTLTKGIAKSLGINQMIKSPTYTIVREYEGELPLYHLDVYRIGDDPDSIDLDEFLFADGVTIIEWGEVLESSLPDDYLQIIIDRLDNGRQVSFHPAGARSQILLEEISDESRSSY